MLNKNRSQCQAVALFRIFYVDYIFHNADSELYFTINVIHTYIYIYIHCIIKQSVNTFLIYMKYCYFELVRTLHCCFYEQNHELQILETL